MNVWPGCRRCAVGNAATSGFRAPRTQRNAPDARRQTALKWLAMMQARTISSRPPLRRSSDSSAACYRLCGKITHGRKLFRGLWVYMNSNNERKGRNITRKGARYDDVAQIPAPESATSVIVKIGGRVLQIDLSATVRDITPTAPATVITMPSIGR